MLARSLLNLSATHFVYIFFSVITFNGCTTMQISNVLSTLADPTTLGKKSETAVQAGSNVLKSLETQNQSNLNTNKAMADVLRKYDVTKISPEQFSQMIQKLYQSGTLSEKDYQELSSIRIDLENAGVEPDESINMLDFYTNKITKAQKELGAGIEDPVKQKSLTPDLHRLDWLQKFATVQANPDAVGLNLAA
jgi:hypothetical protein